MGGFSQNVVDPQLGDSFWEELLVMMVLNVVHDQM